MLNVCPFTVNSEKMIPPSCGKIAKLLMGFPFYCSSRKMVPSSRGENFCPEVPDGSLGLTLCCAASWEDGSVVTWGKDPVDSDGLPSLFCWGSVPGLMMGDTPSGVVAWRMWPSRVDRLRVVETRPGEPNLYR